MNIKTFLLASSLILSFNCFSQSGFWQWGKSIGSPGTESGYDLAVDQLNNVYVTGDYTGNVTIGDTVLNSLQMASYIAKISPEGDILWVRSFNSLNPNGFVHMCNVATDESNNVYVAGNYTFTLEIGDTTIESLGNWDIFIAKFSPEGDPMGLNEIKGAFADNCYNGLIWNNGLYVGVDQTFDPQTQYVIYGGDTIHGEGFAYAIAKFDSDLKFKWADVGWTHSPYFQSSDITDDPNGNLYTLAIFGDSLCYADTVVYPDYYYPNIFRKYDPHGNVLWTKQLPNTRIVDYRFDQKSNMYCCLNLNDADTLVIIGNDTVTPISAYRTMILAKYDDKLRNTWYKTINSDRLLYATQIDLMKNGHIMLGGYYQYTLTIGDTSFNLNNQQGFVAEFNNKGNPIQTISTSGGFIGPNKGLRIWKMTLDHCDNVIVTGDYDGHAYFGPDTITEIGFKDVFVSKYYNNNFSIDLGNDTAVCSSLTLKPGDGFLDYTWSDGSTLPYLEVTSTGLYWVTVTSVGCEATDSIFVEIKPPPVFDLGPDTVLKMSETLRLTIPPEFDSYEWQDGSTANYFDIIGKDYNAGDHYFWVTVGQNGCYVTDSIRVSIIDDFGIKEPQNHTIKIYPNPANRELLIDLFGHSSGTGTIKICDMTGAVISIFPVGQRDNQQIMDIPISFLKPGLYLIIVNFNQSRYYGKLVKR
jgi:hypothetical protein